MDNGTRPLEMVSELTRRSTEGADAGQSMSADVQALVLLTLYAGLVGSVSLCGCVTNIINVAVFSRKGLQESASMCQLLLSLCDLGECITSLLYAIMFAIDHFSPSTHINIYDLSLLISSLPRMYFAELSMCTTLVMSLERCLCIARPLTFRKLVNRRNTAVILGCLYVEVSTSTVSQYFSYPMLPQWDATTNSTQLRLDRTEGPESMSVTVHHLLNNVALTTAAMAIVVVCTCVMVTGLKASHKFRQSARSSVKVTDHVTGQRPIKQAALSARDTRLVQMVTLVSIIFLVCHVPVMAVLVAKKLVLDLNMYGRYHYLNDILWALLYFTAALNATVTVVVYLTISSQYRLQARRLFYRGTSPSAPLSTKVTSGK